MKVMRAVLWTSIVVFAPVAFIQYYFLADSRKKQCKSLAFVTSGFFNQLANIFFLFIGYRIYRSVREVNN